LAVWMNASAKATRSGKSVMPRPQIFPRLLSSQGLNYPLSATLKETGKFPAVPRSGSACCFPVWWMRIFWIQKPSCRQTG
jgi:hypothetical protein